MPWQQTYNFTKQNTKSNSDFGNDALQTATILKMWKKSKRQQNFVHLAISNKISLHFQMLNLMHLSPVYIN